MFQIDTSIRNIVFDFGGVLFDIDFSRTIEAFHRLGFPAFENMYSQYQADQLFRKLEKGEIDPDTFYEVMLKAGPDGNSREQIWEAWNALLIDYRSDSMAHLPLLKKKYRLFLLSNTNIIHYDRFTSILPVSAEHPDLESYFEKAYFSQFIGMRKPDPEIYEFVLRDAGILAAETLFIDDTLPNIETAEVLGFQTLLLEPGMRVEKLGFLTE
jgi:putative hydrolase of the HAD superfamily